MDRDEHVKLLTHTAAILLQSPDVSLPISSKAAQDAVESAAMIIDESIKVVKDYENTGGLYDDDEAAKDESSIRN
jgi:hypothetical protein